MPCEYVRITQDMENQVAVPRKLWEHPDPKSTLMYEFMQDINRKSGQRLEV